MPTELPLDALEMALWARETAGQTDQGAQRCRDSAEIIPRLYIIHVLVLPGILLALIAVHLGLVWYQKHTQFPGVSRTENNVVGVRILAAVRGASDDEKERATLGIRRR